MSILQLLANKNFIVVNKDLAKTLGIEETIILGELASEYDYWINQEKLEDGYFYSTVENIEENTTLSDHKQRKALNKLKEMNLIDVQVKGMPAKRYIRINEEQVFNFFNNKFLKNLRTSSENIKEQVLKNFKTNNNNNNKNNNKNKNKYIYIGTYKRIKLTKEQYTKLIEEFGKEYINKIITRLDEYVESNNNKNKYSNYNLVIRKAIREKWFDKEIKEKKEDDYWNE